MPWTEQALSFDMLLDHSGVPQTFSSPHANNPVLVVELEDGGIIFYQQTDGRMIHTLNTPEGFSRKLRQLGIVLPKTHLLISEKGQAGTSIVSKNS